MRFHDFHLSGYTVTSFVAEIVPELVYDYPPQPVEKSRIKFPEVVAYHFIHTGGAIIQDIADVPIAKLLREVGDDMAEWYRWHGEYFLWNDDRAKYAAALEQNGYRAWMINSAIGFEGFVVAKSIANLP